MSAYQGQVVFITGASSGIGAALAREVARRGASTVLAARRTERLEELAAELEGEGRRSLAVSCDVTRDGEVETAVARALDAFGRIDVVVANAGFGVLGDLEQLSVESYRRQLETNLFGVLRTIYASLEALSASRGRLALMGSVSGHVSLPGGSAYSMSKFALRALAEALRPELAPRGIVVTLVSPGFVVSEFRQVDNQGRHRPDTRDQIPSWLVMPTAKAARIVADAVAKGRAEVVVTLHGKLAVFFKRHFPWPVSAAVKLLRVRARRKPDPS